MSKLCLLLFICSVLTLQAEPTYAQQVKINLEMKNASLNDIISAIKQQTEFEFAYDSNLESIKLEDVSINAQNEKIDNVLASILQGTDINYKVIDKIILLSKNTLKITSTPENRLDIQQLKITGIVTDENGNSLPGVTVLVKGTTVGTLTDASGKYTIDNAPQNATLVFSFVGMTTREIPVSEKTIINVVMQTETFWLNEVVAVGYATQKKINLTGSIVTVNAQDIKDLPVQNPLQSIQGKTPGLQIVQQSGEPGGEEYQIRMRGLTSYGASNSVLVIVDGVQGSLSVINPHDIESISVLKDASSSAIYGARAANGVILITTKSGKKGPMTIEYNVNMAIHNPVNDYKFMIDPSNSLEYIDLRNKACQNTIDIGYANAKNSMYTDEQRAYYTNPGAPNFDWYDYMLNNPLVQDHHLGVYGGTDKARYNVSLGYFDQPATLKGHSYKKYTAKMKADFIINEHIEYGMSMLLEHGDQVGTYGETTSNGSGRSVWIETMVARPTFEPKNALGNWVDRDFANLGGNKSPALEATHDAGYVETYNYFAQANAYLRFHFLNDFTWDINGAMRYSNITEKDHINSNIPTYTYWTNDFVGYWATNTINKIKDYWSITKFSTLYSTLNYTKSLKDSHNIKTMLGYSMESYKTEDLMGSRESFPSNNLDALSAGSTDADANSGGISGWSLMSLFGRVNYDYKGKYLLEASFRYDGSSRFATDYRWGFFPSFSGGWRLSEESFMKNINWMDNLKIRASWGQLGNQDVGTYPYQENVTFGRNYIFSDVAQQGAYISKFPNNKISWETTTSSNAGIDFSILKGLFSLSLDIFDKRTSGIIRSFQVPSALGLSGPTINGGKMKNTGFEFIAGHGKQFGDFRYQIDISGGHVKNELLEYGAKEISGIFIREEGLPYNSYYTYEFEGIFQDQADIDASPTHPYKANPGAIKLKDQNGDSVINSDDRVVIDGEYPKFNGGINISFWYKNFDFSAFLYGVYGRKYMVGQIGGAPFSQGIVPDKIWAGAWTPDNHSNTVPMLVTNQINIPWLRYSSDFWLNDADYLQLKDITFGYNLPASVIGKRGIKGLRIYFSGQNLFIIENMKFSGNPEKIDDNTHNADYPHNRIFSLGVNIKL